MKISAEIPKTVSVAIITYNQEKTIAQTIESILIQKGNFSIELIIGEDCSKDNTASICKEYQNKYPDKIKLILQESNKGLVQNFIDTIKACTGKFIGICAGDDYWIDQHKIEKQLQFFEKNPDFGVVSTSGYRLLVKKNKFVKGLAPLNPVLDGLVFDKTWRGGVYAMPLSLLIKADLLKYIDFEEFLKRKFSVEDVPMQAILAKHTKFGHIDDLCVVYRVYSNSHSFINFNSDKYLHYHEGLVAIRKYLDELFPGEVEYSDVWAFDYLTYRKFLVAVFQFDYLNAKDQISKLKSNNRKSKKARVYVYNKLFFYIFCLIKRIRLFLSTNGK